MTLFKSPLLCAGILFASMCQVQAAVVLLTSGNTTQTASLPNPNGGAPSIISLANGNTSKLFFSNRDQDNLPTPGNGLDVTAVVGLWNEVDTTVAASGGSSVVQNNGLGAGNATIRKEIIYNDTVVSVQVNDVTGQFVQIRSPGTIAITTPNNSYANGGTATFSNLRFDLPTMRIIVNATNKFNTGLFTSQTKTGTNTPAFSYDYITGPTSIPPAALAAAKLGDFSQLQAAGFTVVSQANGTYTAAATIVLNNLRITPEGETLRPDSPDENSQSAFEAIQNVDTGWGDITLKITFNGSFTPPTTVSVGQTATTTRTLPNGVPLRIKALGVGTSELRYSPSAIDNNAPALTLEGMLEWLNVFGITPRNLSGQTPAFNDSILDPRFSQDDPFGYGNIRNAIRVRSTGSSLEFNGTTGEVLSIGGFKHAEMEGAFLNNALAGGYWKATGMKFLLTSKAAYGDMAGQRAAFGSTPATSIASSAGLPIYTYTTLSSGPTTLPLAALSTAASVNDLPAVLQAAGFTVTSVTASEIIFTGTYVMDGLSATSQLRDYACQAWGCAATADASLDHSGSSFVGQFRTPIRLSLPLVP